MRGQHWEHLGNIWGRDRQLTQRPKCSLGTQQIRVRIGVSKQGSQGPKLKAGARWTPEREASSRPVPWVPGFPHHNPSPASGAQDKLALISNTRRSSCRPSTHPGAGQLSIPSSLWKAICFHQVPASRLPHPEPAPGLTLLPLWSHLLGCVCFSGRSNRRRGGCTRRAFECTLQIQLGVRLCFSLTQFHMLRSQVCTSHMQAAQICTFQAQERARLEERQHREESSLQEAGQNSPASAPVWSKKSSLTSKEMELVTYSLPTRKTLGVDGCTGEFYQTVKE